MLSSFSFGNMVLKVGYISTFYWLLAIISSELYNLSCSKLYLHWMFLFVDNLFKNKNYFGVILVEKKLSLLKCTGEWIKSFNDCSSCPSSLVIHHYDNSVPNLFIVVLEFSKNIKHSQNCWYSATDDSVHIISENLFKVFFPKFVFFLQCHLFIFIQSFNNFQRFSKLELQFGCFHLIKEKLDMSHSVVNNHSIKTTKDLSWSVFSLK